MTLTSGDKAECKEIARQIVKEVLKEHVAMCPIGQSFKKAIWLTAGACVGSGIGGGGLVLGILHYLNI